MKPFPQFSPVLFWDTNRFDPERDADTLIERVVEPGTLRDFKEIHAFYGRETVKGALLKSTGLSARDLHFCSIYFDVDKFRFACCTKKSSNPKPLRYWNP